MTASLSFFFVRHVMGEPFDRYAVFVLIYYPFEKVVLIERRTFRCTSCGYELRGLTENRCPECGTGFDPADQSEIAARVGRPAPRGGRRWIVILLIVLLAGTVAANLWTYYQVRKPRPAAPPATSPAPPGTTPAEPQGQ